LSDGAAAEITCSGGWPVGNGRGARRNAQTGISDADTGSTADAGGYGRGTDR